MKKNKLWKLLVMLGLILSLVTCSQKTTPSSEEDTSVPILPEDVTDGKPNDEFVQATEISMGISAGILTESNDDWYKFDVPNGYVFTLTFTPGEDAERMSVSLHNSEQDEIWGEVDVSPTVTKSTTILMNNSSGGTYYAKIGGRHGSYTIELFMENQNDADLGGDAGDDAPHALEVPVGQSFSGCQGDFDDEDWYKFEIPGGCIFTLTFTPSDDAERMNVSLHNSDQDQIWGEVDISPTVTKSTTVLMNNSSGGTYYVQIGGRHGSYTIELFMESQNDANLGGDAGDDAPHALEVPVGQSFLGCQGDFDDEDWYKFEIPGGCIFTLTFTPGEDAERMSISLRNLDQDQIWGEVDISPTVTKSTSVLMNNSSGGMYYAQIGGRHGSYTIELSTESQNDANLGGDAGDDAHNALEVPVGQSFSGYIGNYDEKDWYKFTPTVGHMVSFTPDENSERMSISLRNPDQDEIWGEVDVDPTLTVTFEITEVAGEPYYILVTGRGGHYTIGIK